MTLRTALAWSLLSFAPLAASASCSNSVCDDFRDDAAAPTAVVIRVRNDTAATVDVPIGRCNDQLVIADSAGNALWRHAPCFTCQGLQDEPDYACTEDCPMDSLTIAPGATADIAWSGISYESRQMPATCAASDTADDDVDCVQPTAAPADDYQVSVTGSFLRSCEPDEGCSLCRTASGIVGSVASPEECTGELVVAEPISASASFGYPDETLVEIVLAQ